ncbi:MAG: hypothetical protein H6Q85_503 [candidate division NC10 bacterium]|nr:hypothetical protein [candidate division NC10 bacterium]
MGSWGFIGLAYGVAAVALVGYLIGLRARLKESGAILTALEGNGGRKKP